MVLQGEEEDVKEGDERGSPPALLLEPHPEVMKAQRRRKRTVVLRSPPSSPLSFGATATAIHQEESPPTPTHCRHTLPPTPPEPLQHCGRIGKRPPSPPPFHRRNGPAGRRGRARVHWEEEEEEEEEEEALHHKCGNAGCDDCLRRRLRTMSQSSWRRELASASAAVRWRRRGGPTDRWAFGSAAASTGFGGGRDGQRKSNRMMMLPADAGRCIRRLGCGPGMFFSPAPKKLKLEEAAPPPLSAHFRVPSSIIYPLSSFQLETFTMSPSPVTL